MSSLAQIANYTSNCETAASASGGMPTSEFRCVRVSIQSVCYEIVIKFLRYLVGTTYCKSMFEFLQGVSDGLGLGYMHTHDPGKSYPPISFIYLAI